MLCLVRTIGRLPGVEKAVALVFCVGCAIQEIDQVFAASLVAGKVVVDGRLFVVFVLQLFGLRQDQ